MDVPLTADGCGACKYNSFTFSKTLTKKVEYKLIIYDRILVMNPVRIGPVVEDDRSVRDTLRKISLTSESEV